MNPQELHHMSKTINVFNLLGVEYMVKPHNGMPTVYLIGKGDGVSLEVMFSIQGITLNVYKDGRIINQINTPDPYTVAKHFGCRVIE